MIIPLATMLLLSQQCAPTVAPETLLALVQAESGFDPLAIGVNGPKPYRLRPASVAEATLAAQRLIVSGANIDLGLGQINSRNLQSLGLTATQAFEPCLNLAAAAQVLLADYVSATRRPGDTQTALRTALSLYNTGDTAKGLQNGYVGRVASAAVRIVPAIQPWHGSAQARLARSSNAASNGTAPTQPLPPWQVFQDQEASQVLVFPRSDPPQRFGPPATPLPGAAYVH